MIDPLEHALYRIRNAEKRSYPFEHIWVEDVFPLWYYRFIKNHLRTAKRFVEMPEYPHRQFSDDLPPEVVALFQHPRWFEMALGFEHGTSGTIRWTRDRAGYHLDPHTDHPKKVWTALFYMADEGRQPWPCGTSIYVPRDYQQTSDGCQKHPRDDFLLAYTFPFKANCMLAFKRTDRSWHGVEPFTQDIERDMLFFTLNA